MYRLRIGDRVLSRYDIDSSVHDRLYCNRYNLVLSGNKFYYISDINNYGSFQVIFIYDDNDKLFSFISDNYIFGNYFNDYFYTIKELRLRKLDRLVRLQSDLEY